MNKLSCNIVRDLLPLFIDGAVSKETEKEVQEHLSICEHCKKEYEQLKQPVPIPVNPDLQNESARVLKNMKHNLAKKRVLQSVISVLLVLALIGGIILAFAFYGRERSLDEILPLNSNAHIDYAELTAHGESDGVNLSQAQLDRLFQLMGQLRFKKLQTTNMMDADRNYATLRYGANGHLMELMFSNSKGGCVLVNDVQKEGRSPLYRIVPSGTELQKLLNEFCHDN